MSAAAELPSEAVAAIAFKKEEVFNTTKTVVPFLYEGLSKSQRMLVIFAAIVVVALNMAFGAHVMSASADRVPFGEADQKVVAAFSAGIGDPVSAAVLRSKAIDAVANMKLVSNKQAIVIVAFAGAFSLTAIGFALFVLGSDGVFRLHGEGVQGAKLIFSGTAPGLFCFLVAAALIASGIFHRSELELGETTFPSHAMQASGSAQDLGFSADGTFLRKPGAQ
jgi:hypothetical protein